MNIGENIKNARRSRHLTQKELAELVGVSKQMIYTWEHSNNNLTVATLSKIAIALDIPIEVLTNTDTSVETTDMVEFDIMIISLSALTLACSHYERVNSMVYDYIPSDEAIDNNAFLDHYYSSAHTTITNMGEVLKITYEKTSSKGKDDLLCMLVRMIKSNDNIKYAFCRELESNHIHIGCSIDCLTDSRALIEIPDITVHVKYLINLVKDSLKKGIEKRHIRDNIVSNLTMLNYNGHKKALEQIQLLAKIPEYQVGNENNN